MADTTPLRIGKKSKKDLTDIETIDYTKHYMIHANGLYGNRQYTDLSLLLKRSRIG